MLLRLNANSAGRFGSGESRSTTTASPDENTFQVGFAARREAAATSEVNGVPSENVTPCRRENCQRWLPDSACQAVARAGLGRPWSFRVTRVSNIKLRTSREPDHSAWLGSRDVGATR